MCECLLYTHHRGRAQIETCGHTEILCRKIRHLDSSISDSRKSASGAQALHWRRLEIQVPVTRQMRTKGQFPLSYSTAALRVANLPAIHAALERIALHIAT